MSQKVWVKNSIYLPCTLRTKTFLVLWITCTEESVPNCQEESTMIWSVHGASAKQFTMQFVSEHRDGEALTLHGVHSVESWC